MLSLSSRCRFRTYYNLMAFVRMNMKAKALSYAVILYIDVHNVNRDTRKNRTIQITSSFLRRSLHPPPFCLCMMIVIKPDGESFFLHIRLLLCLMLWFIYCIKDWIQWIRYTHMCVIDVTFTILWNTNHSRVIKSCHPQDLPLSMTWLSE